MCACVRVKAPQPSRSSVILLNKQKKTGQNGSTDWSYLSCSRSVNLTFCACQCTSVPQYWTTKLLVKSVSVPIIAAFWSICIAGLSAIGKGTTHLEAPTHLEDPTNRKKTPYPVPEVLAFLPTNSNGDIGNVRPHYRRTIEEKIFLKYRMNE